MCNVRHTLVFSGSAFQLTDPTWSYPKSCASVIIEAITEIIFGIAAWIEIGVFIYSMCCFKSNWVFKLFLISIIHDIYWIVFTFVNGAIVLLMVLLSILVDISLYCILRTVKITYSCILFILYVIIITVVFAIRCNEC